MGQGVGKEKGQQLKTVVLNPGYNTYGQAHPRLDNSEFPGLRSQPWD